MLRKCTNLSPAELNDQDGWGEHSSRACCLVSWQQMTANQLNLEICFCRQSATWMWRPSTHLEMQTSRMTVLRKVTCLGFDFSAPTAFVPQRF